ncbi:MAG: AzlD domain-containing protein [Ruminococcaceae bacterium]|nr:AzlD domain-containing protein [Oscillospiraceae bacterium]
MHNAHFFLYLAVTAGITYLVRMVPLVLVKRKIRNRFLLSFLHYIPYAVLSVMTVPAIFYATESHWSAAAGLLAALVAAYFERSLLFVAASACGAVFVVEVLLRFLG